MMLVAARDAGVPLGSRCLWGADALCWSERKHPQGEPCCASGGKLAHKLTSLLRVRCPSSRAACSGF